MIRTCQSKYLKADLEKFVNHVGIKSCHRRMLHCPLPRDFSCCRASLAARTSGDKDCKSTQSFMKSCWFELVMVINVQLEGETHMEEEYRGEEKTKDGPLADGRGAAT